MAQKPPHQNFIYRMNAYPHQQQQPTQQHRKPFDLLFEESNRVHYCNGHKSHFMSNPKDPLCDSTSTRRTRRTRTTFSPNQIAELEHNFLQASYLTPERLAKVSAKLGLATTQVKIWFKNRRRRKKLSMERDRLKDEPYPSSLSPSSLTDQVEVYPGPTTPPEGLVVNSGFIAPAHMGTDLYSDSLAPYYYNNSDNNRGSHYAPPPVWSAQYHSGPPHHQQYEYQHKPPPPPLTDTALKTSADFNLNKPYPCCNSAATPSWNLTNGLTTMQSIQSDVYDPLTPKNDNSSGLSNDRIDTLDDFQNESTPKLQQILDLCDGIGCDDMGVKKDTLGNGTGDGSQTMDHGCTRTFYNYNKTPNETQESDLYRTMDTIIKAYNYKNTPTQFAYCFS